LKLKAHVGTATAMHAHAETFPKIQISHAFSKMAKKQHMPMNNRHAKQTQQETGIHTHLPTISNPSLLLKCVSKNQIKTAAGNVQQPFNLLPSDGVTTAGRAKSSSL